jgi:hypothetical protein
MAKTLDQLTALAATPDDSADALLISDAGVTKKITAGNLKGDCIRAQKNNALDSSSGTKIGTNANQLLGFWNATPVDQPAVTADLLDSLQEVGLIASGAGDTPLNLSAGALTCGPIAAGAGSVISGTDNTNAALRVTQTGTGHSLLVEDSTNPDATPFVVNAGGSVVRGHTAIIDTSQGTPTFQCVGSDTSSSGLTAFAFFSSTGTRRPMLEFARSKTNTRGTHTIVGSSDSLGSIRASGSDGVKFVAAAAINFVADGTPGVDDMPGAILLATTADGADAPTERMRIDSAGNVGIGTTANAAALLDVSSTTKGFLPPRMTGAQRDAISTPPAGLMVYNTTTNKLNFYNGSAWEAVTSS